MRQTLLLDPVRLLISRDREPNDGGAALIQDGVLVAFDDEAREQASTLGVAPDPRPRQILAPCLVDPHSVLDRPFSGPAETLLSLRHAAARAGYGQVALLPRANSWRDRVERLQGFAGEDSDVRVHLWGGFSIEGRGEQLSAHGDLLDQGACGLAEDDACPPIALLQRALVLGEMGEAPVLLAPRDPGIQGDGLVREGVATLRAGWTPDPVASETLPLGQLLDLQRQFPQRRLRLMNLSTAAGVSQLAAASVRPQASVCWWHLVSDHSRLSPTEMGWSVTPSLGAPEDREALIQALGAGVIQAVAVHAVPIDEEDCLLPPDQRKRGLAGHQLVLPALWQTLVLERGWTIRQLWEVLSFGPSRLLGQPEERLETGSRRWLLFDPEHSWRMDRRDPDQPRAANQPWQGLMLQGHVTSSGLRSPGNRCD